MAKDGKPGDNPPLKSSSPNTYDMNAVIRPAQPKFDAFRKEAQAGWERHPPKTNKVVSNGAGYNDPNSVGQENLRKQIEVAGEQSDGCVNGL